jgi:thiol-disulfide isomerase/thioredoxin
VGRELAVTPIAAFLPPAALSTANPRVRRRILLRSPYENKNKAMRSAIRLILSTASLCALLALSSAEAAAKKEPKLHVGDVPPALLTSRLKLADYQNKIVIVSFWASWCAPCRKELTVLARIQQVATREKVVIFAVNWKENPDRFREIRHALNGVDLTLVSDPSGALGDKCDVDAIPHMDIIGRDGKIAAIFVGYGEEEMPVLVKEINRLWRGDAPAPDEQTADPPT